MAPASLLDTCLLSLARALVHECISTAQQRPASRPPGAASVQQLVEGAHLPELVKRLFTRQGTLCMTS